MATWDALFDAGRSALKAYQSGDTGGAVAGLAEAVGLKEASGAPTAKDPEKKANPVLFDAAPGQTVTGAGTMDTGTVVVLAVLAFLLLRG